jgi:hypothetical protein
VPAGKVDNRVSFRLGGMDAEISVVGTAFVVVSRPIKLGLSTVCLHGLQVPADLCVCIIKAEHAS